MKNMLKKTGALMMALLLVLTLQACSSGSDTDTETETESADAQESADAESADAQETEEVPEADLTIGTQVTSMLFENSTGAAVAQVAVRNSSEETEDEESGFTVISAEGSTWENGQIAQIYVDVIEQEADESGDITDLILNPSYDMQFTLEDGSVLVLHEVVFSELISLMEIRLDEESGLLYMVYEEDGSEVTTLEYEIGIREEIEAAEAEAAAAAAAEEAAAEAAAEEEESSSSSSSSGSGSSSSSSGSSGSGSSSGSSGSDSYSYDTDSSDSSSGSQSEDQCVDDLIFN